MALNPAALLALALAAAPKEAEIDLRPLPAGQPKLAYNLKITLTTAAGEVFPIPLRFGNTVTPESVADAFGVQLRHAEWKFEKGGALLTVRGSAKSPVAKVEVETDVAKPIVRWRLVVPDKK